MGINRLFSKPSQGRYSVIITYWKEPNVSTTNSGSGYVTQRTTTFTPAMQVRQRTKVKSIILTYTVNQTSAGAPKTRVLLNDVLVMAAVNLASGVNTDIAVTALVDANKTNVFKIDVDPDNGTPVATTITNITYEAQITEE